MNRIEFRSNGEEFTAVIEEAIYSKQTIRQKRQLEINDRRHDVI